MRRARASVLPSFFLILAIIVSALHCDGTGLPASPFLEIPPTTPVVGGGQVVASSRMSDRCEAACDPLNDGDQRQQAVCYSCRCKSALGALPSQTAFQCARGEEIPIRRLVRQDGTLTEQIVQTDPPDCANPALLESWPSEHACAVKSRFGQLEVGESIFKFICRRPAGSPLQAGKIQYDDFGIIGHNPTTGATCFWSDAVTADDGVLPDLDVTDGDEAKVDALLAKFEVHEGDRCLRCHDNDPFMYSPHLSALWDFGERRYLRSAYSLVRVHGPPEPVPQRQLVSPQAAACTQCHRITENLTCDRWVPSATGRRLVLDRPYSPAMQIDDDETFSFRTWMPVHSGSGAHTRVEWESTFGAARDHILDCCAEPNREGCLWTPITQ